MKTLNVPLENKEYKKLEDLKNTLFIIPQNHTNLKMDKKR
jgi:hypothetical protein